MTMLISALCLRQTKNCVRLVVASRRVSVIRGAVLELTVLLMCLLLVAGLSCRDEEDVGQKAGHSRRFCLWRLPAEGTLNDVQPNRNAVNTATLMKALGHLNATFYCCGQQTQFVAFQGGIRCTQFMDE